MFLQQRRRRLTRPTELLRLHTAVLSPIRRVPTEVLEQIFQHCTWELIFDQKCHWRELPWAISQVCRTWRKITLNLPFLWNRLPIHLRVDSWAKLDAMANFFAGLLLRSRNAPLYLYIQAPFKEYDWHPLISSLTPHSQRVEELTIESSIITMNAFRRFKGSLSSLRKLTLSKVSQPQHASAIVLDIFEEAPLLCEVTLIRIYTHEVILPWSQLTSFNGNKINRTGLTQVVANSLDLEHLEVVGYSYGAGPKIATLRRLTSLRVKLENTTITSNFFFGRLNLPMIEEIEVEEYQGDLVLHLIPMLSRCRVPSVLRKLVLKTVVQEAGNLTSLLRLTPQLVELELELPPLPDLSELIVDAKRPPLVPMLETLIIHANTDHVWKKESPVTTLAHSRCEIDETGSISPGEKGKLRTFHLIFPDSSLCHMAQAELNGWLEDSKPKSDQTRHLSLWRDMLHEELPELDYKPPRKRKFDMKFAHRLDRLLGAIENFQLNDVTALYVRCGHIYPYFVSFI